MGHQRDRRTWDLGVVARRGVWRVPVLRCMARRLHTPVRRFRDSGLFQILGNHIRLRPFLPSVAAVVVDRWSCSQSLGRSNCSMVRYCFQTRMPRSHTISGSRFDIHFAHCSRLAAQHLPAGSGVAVEVAHRGCTDNSYREFGSIRRHRCNYRVETGYRVHNRRPDRCTPCFDAHLRHWVLRTCQHRRSKVLLTVSLPPK